MQLGPPVREAKVQEGKQMKIQKEKLEKVSPVLCQPREEKEKRGWGQEENLTKSRN